MVQAGVVIPHWQAQLAKRYPAVAVGCGLGVVALVVWSAWPPLGWAFVALVAWAAFAPWLFYASSHVALRTGALAAWYRLLAPTALLGGVAVLAWQVATRDAYEFPLAVVAVPLAQLIVVLPFVLNTSTDTTIRGKAG